MLSIMIKLQNYLINKKVKQFNENKSLCLSCDKIMVPKKELSVLNLLLFLVIGIVTFLLTKKAMAFLVIPILGIINSIVAKPHCPHCKQANFTKCDSM